MRRGSSLCGLRHWDFPLAALVAYGTLRVLEEELGKEVALSFDPAPSGPLPFLHGLGEDALLAILAEYLESLDPDELKVCVGAEQIKDLKDKYLELLREADAKGDRRRKDFLQAYLALDKKGNPFTTPFDTTDGQQKFLKALDKAYEAAKKLCFREGLRRVLFGEGVLLYPGEQAPSFLQLGWHESQHREWADRGRNPTLESDRDRVRLHPVAMLLAWEALPFYPVVLGPNLKPRPVGFFPLEGRDEEWAVVLPLPYHPVGVGELRALIAAAPAAIAEGRAWARDVEVWVSPRHGRRGQKGAYPTFMAARPWDARMGSSPQVARRSAR